MTDEELEKLFVLLSTPQPKIPEIEFRLYYDDNGKVITYTSEKLSGNYIVITKKQYNEARSDVIIRDGQVIYTHKTTHIMKYTENLSRGTKTSKYDINILTDKDCTYWDLITYEIK